MRKKKITKGFTLLELLIVLAIIAIIAAILIPNFFATTDRARLRSDIQSARVIQNAIGLYQAERSSAPTGSVTQIIEHLYQMGFLDAPARPQSELAEWAEDTNRGIVVNIGPSPDGVHSAYARLSDAERRYVINGRGGGGSAPGGG